MSMKPRHAMLAALTLVMMIATLAPAQEEAATSNEEFLELLRQDVQSEKVMLMTAALELTDEQGEKFWPLYREHQLKISELGDRRIKLIKDFAANYETMTDEMAMDLAKESFKLQEDRVKLVKKTHGKVAKAIGPVLAGRFMQVENQILNVIDVQLAAEMPLIK